jgi:hypothetical protein
MSTTAPPAVERAPAVAVAATPVAPRDAATVEEPLRPLARALFGLLGLAALVQIVVGAAWWVINLRAIPDYGDTKEYLFLAQVLRVDQFRTILYPGFLRGCNAIASFTHLPRAVVPNRLQPASAVAAVGYMVATLWRVSSNGARGERLARVRPWTRRLLIAAITLALATTPLTVHYADTILRDSLATSCLVAALAALIRIGVLGDVRVRTVLIGLAAAVSAELNRVDKVGAILPAIAVLFAGVVLLRVLRRRAAGAQWRTGRQAAALVVLAVVPVAAVLAVDHATQTANYGRGDRDLSTAVTGRFVWMPDTPREFAVYAASPLTYPYDHVSRYDSATVWDDTRMAMAHPHATDIYLKVSFGVLGVVVLLTLLWAVRVLPRRSGRSFAAASVLLVAVLANSVLFANYMTSVNVRYALPAYVIDYVLLAWAALLAVDSLRSRRRVSSRGL